MKSILSVLYALCFLILGCSQSTSSDNPDWVEIKIEEFKSQPVGNPPQSIWQYDYKGQPVYYIPPQCCDQFSALYDAKGNIIGAPDGGISGRGDGRITDFFTERNNGKLIWKDSRQR
jgi:hypothetical protein